jgi:hypothetical protein
MSVGFHLPICGQPAIVFAFAIGAEPGMVRIGVLPKRLRH